jgi:hypothetical protein
MPTIEEIQAMNLPPEEKRRLLAQAVQATGLTGYAGRGVETVPEPSVESSLIGVAEGLYGKMFGGAAGEVPIGTEVLRIGEQALAGIGQEELARGLEAVRTAPAAPREPTPSELEAEALAGRQGREFTTTGARLGAAPISGIGRLRMPSYAPVMEAQEAVQAGLAGGIEEAGKLRAGELETLAGQREYAQEIAGQEYELARERTRKYDELVLEQQQKQQRRQQYMQAEIARVQDTISSFERTPIDPQRFYKHPDGSTNYGKSILAAVAVGLGALSQAVKGGGPNNALRIIDTAINRDIDAQKQDLLTRKAGIGLQMNMLGQMRQQFGQEDQAETMARLLMLKSFENKALEIAASNPDQRVQLRMQQLGDGINARYQQYFQQLQGQIDTNYLQFEKERYGVQAGQVIAQRKALAKAAPPTMPPGMELVDPTRAMPTTDDFKKAKSIMGANRSVQNELNRLIAWREDYGYEAVRGPALATANTMLERVKSAMRIVDKTGARLDPGELKMMGLDFEMGDLGMIVDRLRAVKESVNRRVTDELNPMNIRPSSAATPGAERI